MNSYIFHITAFNLLFLGIMFASLTLMLLLWFASRIDRVANRLMAVLLFIIVLWAAWLLGIDTGLVAYYPHWHWLPWQFSLALGPLVFLYVRKLVNPRYKFSWKDLFHFTPLLIEQGVLLLEIFESARTGAATFETHAFYQLNPVVEVLSFISVTGYLYQSYKLIRYEFGWLRRLLAVVGLALLLGMPYAVITGMHSNYPLYLPIASMVIWIAARTFLKQETSTSEKPPAMLETPLPAELRQKGLWVKKAIEEKLYYRDAELSLRSLAAALDMHPNDLSRLINMVFRKNFSDFINEYRIREVTRKIKDPGYDQLTLLGIAQDAGFSSKTTFNRAFKEITGQTPAEYKLGLKKERPVYFTEPLRWRSMFAYYVKVAWRHIIINKGYSTLNILGLATGMGLALLIGLWVFNQYTYDHFLPNYKQVFQVEMNLTSQHDGKQTQATIALPLVDVLRNEVPGIAYVAATDLIGRMNHTLAAGDTKLYLGGGSAESPFFKIFQYPFIKGNPGDALKDSNSIVLTLSTARSLFGDADPMGKNIKYDNAQNLRVTGIIKDIPANATLQFSYITRFKHDEARAKWNQNSFFAYMSLQPGVTYAQTAPGIRNIVYKRSPQMRPLKPEVILQALKDLHLAGGIADYVHLFTITGILVLVIACINFVNLSTARSAKRAQEVGIRKAVGSGRRDLVWQFLLEAVLITLLSFLLCLYLVQLVLPYFNRLTGSAVSTPYSNPGFWCVVIILMLIIGLTAGCKPAFYLSSFDTAKVLKGFIVKGKAGVLSRKLLVIMQFACSVALIICAGTIYRQIQYVKSRPVGYIPGSLMMTDMSNELSSHYNALKKDLLASGLVESVATSSSPLTAVNSHLSLQQWPGKKTGEEEVNVGDIRVSAGYFKTLGMDLAAGHDFFPDWKTDSLNVIINEAAARRTGLANPVNQLVSWNGNDKPVKIIGIVKDALMESPYGPVGPVIFTHGQPGGVVMYRLSKKAATTSAVETIGKIFERYNPGSPYIYRFVNEEYNLKFSQEVLVSKLAGIFAVLAILISFLGLFGLATYVAEQRAREIVIRKVLGATVSQVWVLLSREFVVLVIISCSIASPVAFWLLHNWLQKFEYRMNIEPAIFILATAAALVITILTVSFHAIKAALAKPARTLSSE